MTGRARSSRRSSRSGSGGLSGVDEMVCRCTRKGLTTGEICGALRRGLRREVSKDTISRITDRVLEEMAEWQNRPLDAVYPVGVRRRDPRQDPRRPGRQPARLHGRRRHRGRDERDILGLWAGDGGEGAKYWLQC